jgi:hypothetical protein
LKQSPRARACRARQRRQARRQEQKPDAWVPTLDRGDRWRHGHGAEARDEDHAPGSPREPSRYPPAEMKNIWTQDDVNIQDGRRMRLSPRITKNKYEMLNAEAMREYIRVHRVRYDTAQERLMKATEMMEWREQVKLEELQRDTQEHNVEILTRLLMERDQELSAGVSAEARKEQGCEEQERRCR